MATSVNPQRLTDSAKIEKWFARNCKFTLGRECSAQEKGNMLVWLGGMTGCGELKLFNKYGECFYRSEILLTLRFA